MILVTGGGGFIGSQVCRELIENGEDVVAFDSLRYSDFQYLGKIRMQGFFDKIKFISGDIRDFPLVLETLKENEINKIIHTAAITYIPEAIKKPSLTFGVNTIGTFNLLEAARILGLEKFVYISTSSVYGDFQYTPADEKHPLEPKDIYGATKLAADRIAIGYNRTYGLPVTVVRTSSVYGPGDLENRAAKIFIENALTGKPLELQGGGEQRRDFSYVKDVAKGIGLALNSEKANGEVFNITGGGDHTIKELATIIKEYIPETEIILKEARSIDANRGALDISKAEKILGYNPRYGLREGIEEYIKWYLEVYAPIVGLNITNKVIL